MAKANRPGGQPYPVDEVLAFEQELGKVLLEWSWEGTLYYEEILEKVAAAYGYADSVAIVGSQSAVVQIAGRHVITKCGIPELPPLAAVPALRALLEEVYAGARSPAEAGNRLREIRKAPPVYPLALRFFGGILLAVAFAIDLVGTWEGVVAAILTAIVSTPFFVAPPKIQNFNLISGLSAAFASGIVAMVAWKWGWFAAAPGLLLISANFIFVPGDSICVQALELAAGRWAPGVDRLFYSVTVLALETAGVILAAIVTATPFNQIFPSMPEATFPWWAVYPGHVVFMLGSLWAFQIRREDFAPALVIVLITTAVAQLGTITYGEIVGSFVGMLVATIVSIAYVRRTGRSAAFVFMITPFYALTPGSHGLRTFEAWISGAEIIGVNNFSSLVGTILALAFGILFGTMIMHRRASVTSAANAG
jgi:uncharacterized membrane protein YjjP (DUF1212 family)/uncharacterized membrane protein YjjB (DUF3815 family)